MRPGTTAAVLPAARAGATHRPRLREIETGQLDELDPPGQRFGDPAHHVGRRAAQNEEARAPFVPVHQDSERVEKLRHALDLVQHDEPVQHSEGQLGVGEPADVRLRLEIEEGGLAGRGKLPGQGRLPALARPEQRGDRSPSRRNGELAQGVGSLEHSEKIARKFGIRVRIFWFSASTRQTTDRLWSAAGAESSGVPRRDGSGARLPHSSPGEADEGRRTAPRPDPGVAAIAQ